MIWLLWGVSDCATSMFGLTGLLLVVSHLFGIPVWVLSVGLEKSRELNFDVRNIFAGSHSEHRWSSCSKLLEEGKQKLWLGANLEGRCCSACDPANGNPMKKSQNMSVWLSKMILVQHFCTLWGDGNRNSNA
jgi:hypothetical protein